MQEGFRLSSSSMKSVLEAAGVGDGDGVVVLVGEIVIHRHSSRIRLRVCLDLVMGVEEAGSMEI